MAFEDMPSPAPPSEAPDPHPHRGSPAIPTGGWSAERGYSWSDRVIVLRSALRRWRPLANPWVSLAALAAGLWAMFHLAPLARPARLGPPLGAGVAWLCIAFLSAAVLATAVALRLPRVLRELVLAAVAFAAPALFLHWGLQRLGTGTVLFGIVFAVLWLASLALVIGAWRTSRDANDRKP